MKSAPAISFEYKPSRRVAMAVAAMTILALVAVALCELPWWFRLLVGCMVLCIAWNSLHRQQQPCYRHIGYGPGGWRLLGTDDVEHSARLRHHATLGPLLTLEFHLDDGGPARHRHFRPVFAGDNLDFDTRRQLILLLARAEVLQSR